MPRLRLRLLGGFRAELDSAPLPLPRKVQALLALLAVSAGRPQPRGKLAGLLWGASPEQQARSSLRQALFLVRQSLLGRRLDPLIVDADSVMLRASDADVDVDRFRRLAAAGHDAALEEAAALYGGPLLHGLAVDEPEFESWLTAERAQLQETAIGVLRRLMARALRGGATDAAKDAALRLLTVDPLHEPAHRVLMRAYAAEKRRPEALRQYRTCADRLRRELGVEPEAETRRLYATILAAETAPAETPRPRAPAETPPPTGGARRPPARPVGRDDELSRVRAELMRARAGEARLVAILGEAGIGKTHLADALATEAAGEGMAVIRGRAYETERILPFGVWVGALRASDLATDATLVNALTPPWRIALSRLIPELAPSGRATPPASENYRRLFEAVAQLLEAWAMRRPLLVVLEDLHWADDVSVRLLAFLGRRLERSAIAVIVTARTEELDPTDVLRAALAELGDERRGLELTLTPLSRESTRSLVEQQLGPSPGTTDRAEQIWQLSSGHPLIAVEAVKAVQEGLEVTGLRAAEVPDRVRQVVLHRLGRLGEPARRLASVAATIGRDFELAVLRDASAMDETEVLPALEELLRRRLLHERADRLEFSHDLIRTVIYGEIGQPRREVLHGRVASAIESRYADDLATHWSTLAVHCRQARVWDKARQYFSAAARQAAQRGAYRDSVALFEAALEAGGQLPARREADAEAVDIRLQLRDLLQLLEEPAAAAAQLREAERLARPLGHCRQLGLVLNQLALHAYLRGVHATCVGLAGESIELARRLGDGPLEGWGYLRLGQAHHALGDHRQAIASMERAETLAGDTVYRLARGTVSAIASAFRVSSLAELGRFDEALRLGQRTVEAAEAAQHLFSVAFALSWLGRAHLDRGDFPCAVSTFERGRSLIERWGMAELLPAYDTDLGCAYALAGRGAEALPLLGGPESRQRSNAARLMARRAEGWLVAGRVEEARGSVDAAVALARELGERAHEAFALRVRGDLLALGGAPGWPAAAGDYQAALVISEALGLRPIAARCLLGLGRLARQRRDRNAATRYLEPAARELDALAMRRWLGEALA